MPEEILLFISEDEVMVRAIVHPFFYSNSKGVVKREAFLHPPGKNDVSLLRKKYATDDFCKKHGKSLQIRENTYCGLVVFRTACIKVINQLQGLQAETKATPMDENHEYIRGRAVFVNEKGLPMHADLLYQQRIEKGEIQTKFRLYANELLKFSRYFHDSHPESDFWMEKELRL